MIKNVYKSSCKVHYFCHIGIFSTDFRKNVQILILMKIRPVRTELFRADGIMDTRAERNDEASSLFRKFAKSA
jgi:hypothetical protein